MRRELHTRGDLKDAGSKNGFIYVERRTGGPCLHRSTCPFLHRLEHPGLDLNVKLGEGKTHARYTYCDTFDEVRLYVTEEDRRQIKDVACRHCKPAAQP